MTKKKHEELVEEIADYLQAAYAMGQHDYKLGIGYGETPRKWDRDRAKKIITLILSAVRDGLEIPDELGRIEGVLAEEIIQQFLPGNEGNLLIAIGPDEETRAHTPQIIREAPGWR